MSYECILRSNDEDPVHFYVQWMSLYSQLRCDAQLKQIALLYPLTGTRDHLLCGTLRPSRLRPNEASSVRCAVLDVHEARQWGGGEEAGREEVAEHRHRTVIHKEVCRLQRRCKPL